MKPTDLDRFKAGGFPDDYPGTWRTFYASVDDVHGVLMAVIKSARTSLACAIYGFDDDEIADAIEEKLNDEHVQVTLTLDSSQAGGVHERKILAREDYPSSIVAVGRSEHGAIVHLKEAVVDGLIVITGSTNWSRSGESLQSNQLTVLFDRAEAHLARCRIDKIHANIISKEKR